MFGPISPCHEVHEGHLPPGNFEFCWCRFLAELVQIMLGIDVLFTIGWLMKIEGFEDLPI